jgi:nucleotide-binding universal stress UspA family protein
MASTIIAGFDGSDAAREAVRFAVRLKPALSADVAALTSYRLPLHINAKSASEGADAAIVSDAHAEADLILGTLHEPGVDSRVVRPGEPARALIEAADELGGELIVVGAHHSARLDRLALSRTADKLVHGAPCPVSIVPAAPSHGELRTIAVAYDAGDAADAALVYAAGLARALAARLILIAVVEPFADGHLVTDDEGPRFRSFLADAADQAAERLRPELDVEVWTLTGGIGETLADACRRDVDLLVAGSRGYGPLHAVLAGSVSRDLAGRAPCPLIVVPREVRTQAARGGAETAVGV